MTTTIRPVQEWGYALSVPTNGPDDRIDGDLLGVVRQMLQHHWERTARARVITWTTEPEVVEAPADCCRPPGAPRSIALYDDYDDEGNGIGPVIGHRYEWVYGWRGWGYQA